MSKTKDPAVQSPRMRMGEAQEETKSKHEEKVKGEVIRNILNSLVLLHIIS